MLGVRFISVNDGYDSGMQAGNDVRGLEVAIKNIINASYSRDLSAKIAAADHVMQKKGMYLGGYRPFGFLSDPNDCHKLILDPVASRLRKKQMKFFPDTYKNCIGKSYNDYIANHQMNMFEDFIGYQGSAVLDESEREADTTSVPMPRGEEFENIPLPDLPEQSVNMQQSSYESDGRGMPT